LNVIETHNETILGVADVCAKFVIDDVDSPFILSGIAKAGNQYTFSFWLRSEASGSITACGKTFQATTEWTKHETTFTADAADLAIAFGAVGTYYIYQPQLETGTMATAWRPAPEDMASASDMAAVTEEIESVSESVASVDLKADGIIASVSAVEKKANNANDSIAELTKEVSAKMTAEAVEIKIKTAMENGATKVDTTTGVTVDDRGITVDKTGSEMKTTISENGMVVKQNEEDVLTANNNGVDAKNLHATTYLIVGGRSRFENYGTDRTGCFWIGG
jgi:uncharacterized protein YcfL